MIRVHLNHLQEIIEMPSGSSLMELDGKIRFGCRAAACGRCAIQVLEGSENISSETEKEIRAKKILGLCGPEQRLACQATVYADITLESLKVHQKGRLAL